MKNQRNMTAPNEHSKLSVTDFKEMEIHELFEKKIRTIIVHMLRELQ